jgi:signal peptidase I
VGDLRVGAVTGSGEPGDGEPAGPAIGIEATGIEAAGSVGTGIGAAGAGAAGAVSLGAERTGSVSSGPAPEGDGPGPGAEPGPARRGRGTQRSFWRELPLLAVVALVLALLIKTFLVQAFSIPSGSMEETLHIGDRVLVDKLTPWFGAEPTRGEVVVFHDPGGWLGENPPPSSHAVVRGLKDAFSFIGLVPSSNEKDLIKRVVAVGGDTVSCHGSGPLIVNGKPLHEPYVYPGNTPCSPEKPFTVTVPKGRMFVMGDHRQNSRDSRYHMTGTVDGEPADGTVSVHQVVGRAIVVAWPVNRWDWLEIPATFSQPGVDAAGGAVPAAAGLAGALPLILLRRRRMLRHEHAKDAVPAE